MTWPFRDTSVIISAQLHRKLATSCLQLNLVDSEVLAVRTVGTVATRETTTSPCSCAAVPLLPCQASSETDSLPNSLCPSNCSTM